MATFGRVAQGAMPGMGRLAQAIAQGGNSYGQAYDNELKSRSQMAQAIAATRAQNAAAEQNETETDAMRNRPQIIDQALAARTNTSLPLVQAFKDFQRTGQMPMKPAMGPAEEDGTQATQFPVLDDSSRSAIAREFDRLLPMYTNTKDTKPDDYAKGQGLFQQQDQEAAVWNGRADPLKLAQLRYAARGDDPFKSDSSGLVTNVLTGKLDESSGRAGAYTGELKSKGRKHEADAVESYASAGLKKAQTGVANSIGDGGYGMPLGASLGAPVPAVAPWANQTNPKDANKVKAAEMARGAKEIEKDAEAADKARSTADNATRFIELNEKVGTGGVSDKFPVGRFVNSFGGDYAEMEAITAKLAPAMREPGSGTTSDFDGKQFERATVGVDKPKATNQNIARALIARSKQSQDYADFRQTYLEQNGTLVGADRYWKQYVDKNPIFDPAQPGSFTLNDGRKAWRDHFSGGGAPSAPPKPAPKSEPPAGGAYSDAEKERRYQEWKAKQK